MERKIGEIFEYDGEWYQCVEGVDTTNCSDCDIQGYCIRVKPNDVGQCLQWRSDKKKAIFKKLEKVGEPYRIHQPLTDRTILFQRYRIYEIPIFNEKNTIYYTTGGLLFIDIEIKQNQENMEEKKDELEKLTSAYVNGKITYGEYEEKIEKYYKSKYGKESMEENKLNLKPFDLEKAKSGKPVCTRDGRKARIICFDMKGDICPMVAAVEENGVEYLYRYDEKGLNCYKESNEDLMMLPEKHEGWINIVKTEDGGYCCRGAEVHSDYNDAILENINVLNKRGIIVKIEWEE